MALDADHDVEEARFDDLARAGVQIGLRVANTGAVVARKATTVATQRAVAQATTKVVASMASYLKRQSKKNLTTVMDAVRAARPEAVTEEVIRDLERDEREREDVFQEKVLARWREAIPRILAMPDPQKRTEAMRKFRAREGRLMAARHQAMMERADGAANRHLLKALSPQGAYWKLNEFVNEHTLDCLVLGEKFWPWSVLDEWNPPLHHGCPCTLMSLTEAIERGLMTMADIQNPVKARRKARSSMKRAERLMESLLADEGALVLVEALDSYEAPVHDRARLLRYSERFGVRREVAYALGLEEAPEQWRVERLADAWLARPGSPEEDWLVEAAGGGASFRNVLHPRDRRGKWIEVLDKVKPEPGPEADAWSADMRKAVSHGAVSPEEAQKRGLFGAADEKYEPLPKVLFHVTTALSKVRESGGLKTREELGGTQGAGLGGGPQNTISFTDDRARAERVKEAILEASAAARGDTSIGDMIAEAKRDGFYTRMLDANAGTYEGARDDAALKFAPMPPTRDLDVRYEFREPPSDEEYAAWLKKNDAEPVGDPVELPGGRMMHLVARAKTTESEQRRKRLWVYKQFALARQMEGGKADVIFWDTDPDALAELDPKEVDIVTAKPVDNAMGTHHPGEHEWRVHTGDVVPLETDAKVDAAGPLDGLPEGADEAFAATLELPNVRRRRDFKGVMRDGDEWYVGSEFLDASPAERKKMLANLVPPPPGTPMSAAKLDAMIEDVLKPEQLDADTVPHPKSGYQMKVGRSRQIKPPPEGEKEAPLEFNVVEHDGPPNFLPLPKKVGTEPVKFVYRGVSDEEWEQAQKRGFLQSDLRGVISDWEGTNAGVDPRTAVSYLPNGGTGRVLKIAVKPEDDWFAIRADSYARTRKPIPLDRVVAKTGRIQKNDVTGLRLLDDPS